MIIGLLHLSSDTGFEVEKKTSKSQRRKNHYGPAAEYVSVTAFNE